jgi:hypothetical protein
MDLSPGSLFGSLIVGAIGFVLFVYGKKQNRMPQLIAGVILSVFPMLVSSLVLMAGITVGVIGGLVLALRAGY